MKRYNGIKTPAYYTPKWGVSTLKIMQQLLVTRKDVLVKPRESESVTTLYHRLTQSMFFVIDHLDDDKKFKALRDEIILKTTDDSVYIIFKTNLHLYGDKFVGYRSVDTKTEIQESTPIDWDQAVTYFLNGDDKEFHISSGFSIEDARLHNLRENLKMLIDTNSVPGLEILVLTKTEIKLKKS